MKAGPGIIAAGHGTHRGAFAALDWTLFLLAGCIWGSSFLLMAVGLEALRPGLITWLRILCGSAVLWSLPGARMRIAPEDWPRLALLSITWMAAPLTLFPVAQRSVNSAITGMLNGTAPIFTALIGAILLRHPPGPRQLVGIPLGFIGVTAIALSAARTGPSQALGVTLIITATLLYSIAYNVAPPLQQRYGALPVVARILAIGAVLTAPFGMLSIPGSRIEWLPLAAVTAAGVLGTGIAYALMGRLVGRVGSTRAATVNYIIPVVALGLGVIFRGDEVRPAALVGVALALLGAYVTSRRETREE